jgi:hypothetical protein
MYSCTFPSISGLEGVGVQRHGPAALPLGSTGTRYIGGWVGPSAGLDGWKISPPQGFEPLTVQPVASRCTDWAIPAHKTLYKYINVGSSFPDGAVWHLLIRFIICPLPLITKFHNLTYIFQLIIQYHVLQVPSYINNNLKSRYTETPHLLRTLRSLNHH